MTSRILLRRGTAAQWASANPILGSGELGVETDTLKFKIGNGTSTWTQLTSYANITPSQLTSEINNLINAAPSTLDTLNELAAAINNDASFSTTVNNLLTGKVSKSGGDIITAATASTTPLAIRAAASQTADLLVWQNNSGTTFGRISSNGILINQFNYFQYVQSLGGGSGLNFDGSSTIAFNTAPSQVVFKVAGYASQTANLQEWQNSAGTVVASVGHGGWATFVGGGVNITGGSSLLVNSNIYSVYGTIVAGGLPDPVPAQLTSLTRAATTIGLLVRGFASQTANLQEWQNSAGTVKAYVNVSGDASFGSIATGYYTPYSGAFSANALLYVNTNAAGNRGIVVDGWPSQTADLQQWRNSSGTVLANVDANGVFILKGFNSGYNFINIGGNVVNSALINISPTNNIVPILIRGVSGQTANLTEWQNSAGYAGTAIDSGGSFYAPGIYASYLMQVTSGGAAVVPMKVKGAASQSANLQEWQNSAGTVIANITPAGKIAMKHINGISGDMLSLGSNGASDILVVGYDNISAVTYINGGSYGPIQVQLNSAANGKFVIKGAASQTANLQEWQNSAGSVLSRIDSYGRLGISTSILQNSTGGYSQVSIANVNTTDVNLIIKAYASQTANLTEWQNSAGTVVSNIYPNGTAGLYGLEVFTGGAGITGNYGNTDTLQVRINGAARRGILVKGAASQTANLQEWQNSAGTVLTSISSTGKLTSAVDASINEYTLGRGSGNIYTNVVFGYNAFASNTTGNQNVALGWGALTSNTTGSNNFALGNSSLGSVTTGSGNVGLGSYTLPVSTAANNVAIGIIAMYSNTTGGGNIAIGAQALQANTTGINNTVIGQNVLYSNVTGYFNTAIGNAAGFSNTGVSNVFIGYNAGYNETGSNKLYIANTNTATPLIGGDFSAKTLTIAGNATITSQATGTVGLIVKAVTSQTADLQQWQNSAGSVVASIANTGSLTTGNLTLGTNGLIIDASSASPYIAFGSNTITINTRNAAYKGLIVQGAASQTANLQEWQSSSGEVGMLFNMGNAGNPSTLGFSVSRAWGIKWGAEKILSTDGGSLIVTPYTTDRKVLIVKGVASQTADLQQWQNSSGTVLAKVDASGSLELNGKDIELMNIMGAF